MPALDPRDFHLDAFLTNLSIAYRLQGTIADQLFPVVNVMKQTGVYAKVDRGNWLRVPNTLRAPGTAPREVNYTVSSGTYLCLNYELATRVAWETIDNADPPHAPLVGANNLLRDQLMLDYEERVRSRVAAGVGSSTTLTGANAWTDGANSDPLGNMDVAKKAIRKTTGLYPNVAVVPEDTWLVVRRHPQIVLATYPGGAGGGTVTPEQFANLIGVDRVLIPRAIKVTTEEGQTDAFADVWSTNVTMAYVANAPGLEKPSFGYTFRWSGPNIGAGAPGNFQVQRREDGKSKTTEMQTGYYSDENIVASELGFEIRTGV